MIETAVKAMKRWWSREESTFFKSAERMISKSIVRLVTFRIGSGFLVSNVLQFC